MKDKDAELREEIASHLQMATTDRIERGAPPIEAAVAARRELGNISQIQEATRDVWGRRWLEQIRQDVRYAMRTFRRNPAFALVAILSLTLGIGANTALFEVVTAVKLRVLPVTDPDRLVEIRLASMDGVRGGRRTRHSSVTQPIWREIQARQQAFSSLFAWSATSFNLAQGGEVRLTDGVWVTGDFFTTLGLRPAAGRVFSAEDDRTGCTPRAVLGYDFWRRAYASDVSAVGRTITLESRPVEIIGVAPPGFHGLLVGGTFDVALPLCAEPLFSDDGKGLVGAGTDMVAEPVRPAETWLDDRPRIRTTGCDFSGGISFVAAVLLSAGERSVVSRFEADGVSRRRRSFRAAGEIRNTALAAAWDRRTRFSHRVREPGEPAAGPRFHPRA